MEAIVLVLTLYCGVPVQVFISIPEGEGRRILVGPVTVDERSFWLDQEAALKLKGAKVTRLKVEDVVSGIKCPVSS